MPIKASSARHVDALISDLHSDDPVARDAAVARLAVIGRRAVDRLVALGGDRSAPPAARIAAFRALEGIADPRAQIAALAAVGDADDDVAVTAVVVLRGFVAGNDGLEALDTLTSVALDAGRADAVREAAVRALRVLDTATVGPILDRLLTDHSPRLRALAQGGVPPADETTAGAESWLDHLDTRPLPADAGVVRHEIARRGQEVSLALLHHAIERIREREATVPPADRRAWLAARSAAHLTLAQRGSRVALYDAREALQQTEGPLPSELLDAVAAIGDAACLEPIVALYARAASDPGAASRLPAGHTDAWSRHLADTFRAIVERERLTARSAVAKKITRRWPDVWDRLTAK